MAMAFRRVQPHSPGHRLDKEPEIGRERHEAMATLTRPAGLEAPWSSAFLRPYFGSVFR
jgi:hypothetical protein